MKSIFTFILLLVITFSAQAQDGQYLMSSSQLEVRSGPGLQFNTIAEVAKGTQVYVMSSNYGDWSAIQFKSMNGFVLSSLLTKDSRVADAERAAKEAAARREAAKQAAVRAVAQAEEAKRAAEEAARKAIANAERLKRDAEAVAAKAIQDADAATKSSDAAARRALADTKETQKALEEARRRAAQGGDVAATPIESTTPSYGSSTNTNAGSNSNSSSSPRAATIEVSREDKYSSWEKKTYKSGATPKSFNFKGKFDYKLDNYLKIKVGKNTEVVVKMYKMGKTKSDDQLVRVTYINSNTTQFIRNVPEGEYFLKIAYGKEWKETVLQGKKYGTFTKNALYEKSEQVLNFNTVKTSKGINVPSYNLALDLTSGGYTKGASEDNITADRFNEN